MIVTYFAASRFFGERAGLCSAALIAVSRWHVTFSRMGFRAILAPLWVSLVALALWWLMRRRSRGAAVAVRCRGRSRVLHLSRLLVGAAGARAGRCGGAVGSDAPALHLVTRQVKPLAAAAVVSCLLVTAPAHDLRHHPRRGSAGARARSRAGRQSATDPPDPDKRATTLLDGTQRVLFMLHLRGDIEPRHNIPGRPMLDLVSGLLFLGGLIAIAKADWPLPSRPGCCRCGCCL